VGVDIDPDSGADIIASALALPFEDESVDEIYSAHLVEHFNPDEAQKFFDEIYRVLKRKGTAVLKIDRDWSKKRLLKKDATHKYRFTADEIKLMVGKFSAAEVKNRIYFFNFYTPRNKIFVSLKK
jgi:ubiquinone/menaquinone biosynthesis C-methylase UbiE